MIHETYVFEKVWQMELLKKIFKQNIASENDSLLWNT